MKKKKKCQQQRFYSILFYVPVSRRMYCVGYVCFMFRFNIHLLIFRRHAFGGDGFFLISFDTHNSFHILCCCFGGCFFILFILLQIFADAFWLNIQKKKRTTSKRLLFLFQVRWVYVCVSVFFFAVSIKGHDHNRNHITRHFIPLSIALYTIASMFKICVIFFPSHILWQIKYCKNEIFFFH